jgi:head-tail adaptor
MAVGEYRDRVQRMIFTTAENPQDGQDVEDYTPGGKLWVAIEQLNGLTDTRYDGEQTGQTATIRIHGFPQVNVYDRLKDAFGQVWEVRSKVYGTNEIVCDCEKLDSEDE